VGDEKESPETENMAFNQKELNFEVGELKNQVRRLNVNSAW
jgi:hypothetical protein